MKRFEWIKPDMLVYDIGANVGVRTRQFMAMGAKVVAIEPNAALIPQLRQTRATIINAAIGAKTEMVTFYIGQSHTLSTTNDEFMRVTNGRFGKHKWVDSKQVQQYSLTQILASNYGTPEFIKIDVEGAEVGVIKGMGAFRPDYISYEFTPELFGNHLECAKLLGKGYVWNYGHVDGEELAFDGWVHLATLNKHLKQYTDKVSFGDVYGKLKSV